MNYHSKYENKNQSQHQFQRINRISKQLNKLDNLIQHSKNQSIKAFKILQKCNNSNSSSDISNYYIQQDKQILQQQQQINSQNIQYQQNAISHIFNDNDSNDTIQIQTKHMADQFYQQNNEMMKNNSHYNRSLGISESKFKNNINLSYHNNNNYINQGRSQYQNNNIYDLHQSNISSEFKQSAIQISQIKPIDTTIKKAKLHKANLNKNKKNLFEKQRILSKNNNKEKDTHKDNKDNNDQKIGRIKSENKLISNASNFKRGINIIKQMSLKKDIYQKQKDNKSKNNYNLQQNISNLQKNYLSNKIQTLNSKRNLKYNSVTKNQKQKVIEKQKLKYLQKQKQKNSKSKFHLNLQKQVTMKITDLKIKKNLCQIQTLYLSASVKITKEEIIKIDDTSTQYSDQTLLKYFIMKSIIKFISQYNDQTWTNSQQIQINNQIVSQTLKKPQKFIKIINKLPDILRRRNIVSQFICKQFIEQKSFIQQKLNNLPSAKSFQKQPLYIYLCQLHSYIEFLLNNNMIHQTKRNKIFNPTSEEFFSDRSAKQMKLTVNVISSNKESKFIDCKKKQFSERKKANTTTLKRVNTSKALKKSVNANNSSKIKKA